MVAMYIHLFARMNIIFATKAFSNNCKQSKIKMFFLITTLRTCAAQKCKQK
jgi:hypothetical protein